MTVDLSSPYFQAFKGSKVAPFPKSNYGLYLSYHSFERIKI